MPSTCEKKIHCWKKINSTLKFWNKKALYAKLSAKVDIYKIILRGKHHFPCFKLLHHNFLISSLKKSNSISMNFDTNKRKRDLFLKAVLSTINLRFWSTIGSISHKWVSFSWLVNHWMILLKKIADIFIQCANVHSCINSSYVAKNAHTQGRYVIFPKSYVFPRRNNAVDYMYF